MSAMDSLLFTQPFIHAKIKENIKAPRHWPLSGEFTGDRWIPRTKGQWRGKCSHLMTSSRTALFSMAQNNCQLITWSNSVLLHYSDLLMSTMASQITSVSIVYSSIYSGAAQNKTSKLRVTGLWEGNSPVAGEFRAQKDSNVENISIWWRHHEQEELYEHIWLWYLRQCKWFHKRMNDTVTTADLS